MDILEKALEKSVQNESIETKKSESKASPQPSIESKQRTVKVDWNRLAVDGYLSREQLKSALIEEYRMIKRPLISNAFGKSAKGINRANLLLVTSSIPGEGKTFSAINLALSIANERDKNVLLIDADVAKPTLAKRLGIVESPGLIEYLESDDVDFSEICFKTDLPSLQVIPAGKRHAFSTELLSSDKMAKFVDELSQRYPDRIVIFDSPPLLAATQAEVLASLVGQVVFVISAETTMQSTVQDAIKKLESVDVVLALLNKSKHELNLDHYGYGQYGH
ncbi:MAG: AAA family ATPase [Methyloprofundus sp.]|nr:AAA family ATPase [Methyloprofundus sp.]